MLGMLSDLNPYVRDIIGFKSLAHSSSGDVEEVLIYLFMDNMSIINMCPMPGTIYCGHCTLTPLSMS